MQRVLAIAVALAMSISLAFFVFARRQQHDPSTAEDFAHQQAPIPMMWPAPDFSFPAHDGTTVSKLSLSGKPFIANFIFTTCRTVCPLLTAKMVRLQRELPGADLQFVSFSVDPGNDTVAKLSAYQQKWNADEKRWRLLETTEPGLASVASGFRITAQRTDGGLDAVMHSAVFVLVDGQGIVRGAFDSEDSADFKKLIEKTRALLGSNTAPPPRAERSGEVLFHELSCANCHESNELAPQLGGLVGQRRELDTRSLVTADEAYVKESILSPDAKRVSGFPLRMPSYAGLLTGTELNALYIYVSALPAPVAAAVGSVETDPVCHMKVRVTQSALRLESDAGIAYFCSAWCRDRFRENPDAYRH